VSPREAYDTQERLVKDYKRQLEISCDRTTLGRHAFTPEQARNILAGYRDGLRHAFELLVPGVRP
jgi:hypothetical protein